MALAKRTGSTKQSTDVRFSDRGYPYGDMGTKGQAGLVPICTEEEKPALAEIPPGVAVFNTTTQRIEVSDPENSQWLANAGEGGGATSSIAGGSVPASSDSPGLAGQIRWDENYLYFHNGTRWVRGSFSAW